ncbi:hypothetical protein JAAARDRAFT_53078 [Jaapia argillacea MUCL 33604]|uniref:DUF6570 domain-containing protein n=1 Tax=Jaapia argillacea MUCL 33604 TaxID=933084 RepID=A0A067QDT5_9AGAM|nr:hypothetical protein JAAARDRAFT_53078 [Jaapia argillacea MUCL 33604]
MLISRGRASQITHLYCYNKTSSDFGKHPDISQRYNRGNIAIMPQDSISLRTVLPPDSKEVNQAMCVLFVGGNVEPTEENIRKIKPILISKSCVSTMINFLIMHNSWYKNSGVTFSAENLMNLFSGGGSCDDIGIPSGVELGFLPNVDSDELSSLDEEYDEHNNLDNDIDTSEIVIDAVGYTTGDRTHESYQTMQAKALAWCLDRKKFIKMCGGTKLISDREPGLLTFLFPNLDTWGIGGFYEPNRSPSQYISFERQLKNLLSQADSPFRKDSNFAYICWNILQKREMSRSATFCTKTGNFHKLTKDLRGIAPYLPSFIQRWEQDPFATPRTGKEKEAFKILQQIRLLPRNFPGTSGYKQC